MSTKDIEIEIKVIAKTDSAIKIFDGKRTEWIPLSQISDYSEEKDGKWTSIFIPEWLAMEKGLI